MNKNNLNKAAKCIRNLAEALEDDVEDEIVESISGTLIDEQEAGEIMEILRSTRDE